MPDEKEDLKGTGVDLVSRVVYKNGLKQQDRVDIDNAVILPVGIL